MLSLSITADDFGYCKRRNKGILELFKAGIVSNTSLLVNAVDAADAIAGFIRVTNRVHCESEKQKQLGPIGLHFNLTEGKPLTEAEKIPSLINESGKFWGKFGFREKIQQDRVAQNEIKLELAAQVECFKTLLGCLPAYVDGHQHVHVIPQVASVFADVLKSYGILKTRLPIELQVEECKWLNSQQLEFYKQVCKDASEASDAFRRFQISYPDFFIGLSTSGTHMNESNVYSALKNVTKEVESGIAFGAMPSQKPVSIEFMVHPGYRSLEGDGGCGDGPDDFSLSTDRELEMDFLRCKLNILLQNLKIQLQSTPYLFSVEEYSEK